jgi:hypothetical protein
MKRILLSLAALAFAATMNAQVWIGGEVGFTTNHTNGSDHTAMELTIAPDIGYSLSSNFSVAVALSYGHTSNGDGSKYGMPDMTLSNVNSYSIMPYTCYTFAKAGNFAFFVISGLKYSIDHAQGLESNFNRFGVFVIPAIAFSVSDKVTLASHIGDGLYYNHTWMKDVARSNEFGFNLFHGISFGAYYFF